ncbi:MAG: hypothetical protein DMD99_13550 [Candidatus Rokuibacteriota bacterium]|nr:MAG: hypothetical protein DMD99_13550 [Candidatus Rokubacteria bacterium]
MVHGRSDTTIRSHGPRRPGPRSAARARSPRPPAPARRAAGARSPPTPDRSDRRALARRPRTSAGPGTRAVPRAAAPRAWLPDGTDERRASDLDSGFPDGGDVRRAARYSRFPLSRQASQGRRLLPPRRRRGERREGPGGRPSGYRGRGRRLRMRVHRLLRTLSKSVVLAWVLMKGSLASLIELSRAALRFVADPLSVSPEGWKWLAIKIGISLWLREFFTLAVAHDLYSGIPTIYVNYLDYDIAAHAWGPRHRRALSALRRVDASIHRLSRILRRVPEYRYDLYVLSDHGQATCIPYRRVTGGPPIEQSLFDDFFDPAGALAAAAPESRRRRFARGLKAYRAQRAPGFFQRFVNYLERDFARILGETPDARERAGIRVIAAGPNAFVYFLESAEPLTLERIEARFPALATAISGARGIGLVLVRSASGPLCFWRGRRYGLDELHRGPFAGRPDLERVVEGIRDLMAMPSAGDLVIYGSNAPQGDVSFISEVGAHAGPSSDELHTFLIHPRGADIPSPITHPIQLYSYFVRYQPEAV